MGKLIVLEGTDGSGKATQCAALTQALTQMGYSCRRVEFPQYDKDSSMLIRMYLNGAFGDKPTDVNGYAASTFYAVDRYASYKTDWGKFYEDGGVILADRYTTSNAVHQGSKLEGEARQAFFQWLFDFEYRLMGMPEPDMVLYLDVPVEQTAKNMHQREIQTNTTADIHEKDQDYLNRCRIAGQAAAKEFGWNIISCTEHGAMRSISDIHQEILCAVKEIL